MKLKVVIFPLIILVLFLEGLAVGQQVNAKNKAQAHKTVTSKAKTSFLLKKAS